MAEIQDVYFCIFFNQRLDSNTFEKITENALKLTEKDSKKHCRKI